MSAVARLVFTYFTPTPLMRALVVLGLALVVAGIAGYASIPVWTLGNGMRSEGLVLQALVLGLPWLGLILLLAASALMPAMVERMALGRLICVLPGGRGRLLASIVLPAALLAVLTGAAAAAAFVRFVAEPEYTRIFYRTILMAFVDFGLIYAAIWLVGKTSGVWRLAGLFWVVVSIAIPVRYLNGIPPLSPLEGLGLAAWLAFGVVILSGGRARHVLRRLRARTAAAAGRCLPSPRYAAGAEIDLFLGISRPWVIALGQVIPIAVMVPFVAERRIWIVFLIIFSAISGAVTSQAAARSRRLWLRYDWRREQFFGRVERAYWRYNAHSLAVLLLLFVAFGMYAELPIATLLPGVALVAFGCTVFNYLGLMITRGLGWFESVLCIVTMTALGLAALALAHETTALAVEIELLLAGLAAAYWLIARARWSRLDWMRSRLEVSARGAG